MEVENDFVDRNTTIPAEDAIDKYVLNTNTKKFHLPTCDSVNEMKEKNKKKLKEIEKTLSKKDIRHVGDVIHRKN